MYKSTPYRENIEHSFATNVLNFYDRVVILIYFIQKNGMTTRRAKVTQGMGIGIQIGMVKV